MSQAKVDQYKKEKSNRKKTMAKEKRIHVATIAGVWVVVLAIIGWAGFSGYNYHESHKPAKTYQVTTDAVSDYLSELSK